MKAPTECVRVELLREWAAHARKLIDDIDTFSAATGRPIPPHLADRYARACGEVAKVEAAVAGDGLGFIPLLWLGWAGGAALLAATVGTGYVLYETSKELASSARQGVKQVAGATAQAMALASYAVVGIMVYNFARKRRAA